VSELPDSWLEAPIGDVTEVNPRKDVDLSGSDLVSFVPMAAVDEVSGIITGAVDRPYGEVSTGFTHFRDSDVIFAKITPSMENGKSAVAHDLTNGTGMGSTEFHVFRSQGAIEPEYLWRFVRQKAFRDAAQGVMSGAVGQQRVPADYLRSHTIPLAPLPEQRRIVAKVDGLTARTARARKELNRIPTLIARHKQRLLALAFSGELTATWRREHRLQEPTLKEVLELSLGLRYGTAQKCYEEPHGVAVLRIPNVSPGKLNLSDLKYAELPSKEFEKLKLHTGDILVIRSNGSVDLIGRPALVDDQADGMAYAGYLIRIRPKKDLIIPKFLALMLESPPTRTVLTANARSTNGIHNLNAQELGAILIPHFHIDEQAEIVRRIESAFGWLDRIAADHAAAARLLPKLDSAILAKAFRGELVPQDPNDEPVSVLLERIKAQRSAPQPRQFQGRKAKTSKDQPMTVKPLSVRDKLLKDSRKWPPEGLSYDEIAKRIAQPYDEMRDALFELLSGTAPPLVQKFDRKREVMVLLRAAA
jgi:type I restriction enzyme S subunit